jgi:glyoxylase-like metal-dependent hydrolase (beta-lactamase superfamily II)
LAHGEVLDLAGFAISVIHTPGHTPGHCCFHVAAEGVLFSGDQLFAGSIGRTDLPGGDFDALMRSMGERVLTLPPATTVLPGHGPATTLARELETNPFLETFRT